MSVRIGKALRWPGLRTYRRACPATNGLSRIFSSIGIAEWRYFCLTDSMPDSLIPSGEAIIAIFPSKGRYRFEPKIFPPNPYRSWMPLGVYKPRQEVQHHLKCNVCRPAKKLLGLRGGAQPIPNFKVAGRRAELAGLAL
jgi:hypothetical protein